MGKKPKHRVRHVPPGPCGIWFQAAQAKKKQRRNSTSGGNHGGQGQASAAGGTSDTPAASIQRQLATYYIQNPDDDGSPEKGGPDDGSNTDTPPAWRAMQIDTRVTTPYNPTPWTTIIDPESRYEVVRSNLPDHYVTLWEILRGDHDMKLSPDQRLRVLVHAVEMSNHHNIWTVDLRDDTGASMRAWMDPQFIQEQISNSNTVDDEMEKLKPGLVWILKDVSMIIMPPNSTSFLGGSSSSTTPSRSNNNNNNFSEERLERMLLIGDKHIEYAWTPPKKENKEITSNTLSGTQQSSNSDDHHLEGEAAFATPPSAKQFGDGKNFALSTPNYKRDNIDETSTPLPPPAANDSVNGLFSQMRREHNATATVEPERKVSADNRPHKMQFSQFAATDTKAEPPVNTPTKQSSQNSQKNSFSLTPLDLSLDAATALGRRENGSQEQQHASTMNPSNTMDHTGASLYTQESTSRQQQQQQSAHHTPRRNDRQSPQRSSQPRSRKKNSHKAAATRTPPRSTMSQDSTLLTPSSSLLSMTPTSTSTSRRKRKVLSPKAVLMSTGVWNMTDTSGILKMIADEENRENGAAATGVVTAEGSHALKEQPADSDDSESPPILSSSRGESGTLFDPSSWDGVDMGDVFDDDDI